MPACVFQLLCEGFHSRLCVPASKPAVLKRGEKWREEGKLGGQTEGREREIKQILTLS